MITRRRFLSVTILSDFPARISEYPDAHVGPADVGMSFWSICSFVSLVHLIRCICSLGLDLLHCSPPPGNRKMEIDGDFTTKPSLIRGPSATGVVVAAEGLLFHLQTKELNPSAWLCNAQIRHQHFPSLSASANFYLDAAV
jgi:hypothetical protein